MGLLLKPHDYSLDAQILGGPENACRRFSKFSYTYRINGQVHVTNQTMKLLELFRSRRVPNVNHILCCIPPVSRAKSYGVTISFMSSGQKTE
jgi:hypothetical protein